MGPKSTKSPGVTLTKDRGVTLTFRASMAEVPGGHPDAQGSPRRCGDSCP